MHTNNLLNKNADTGDGNILNILTTKEKIVKTTFKLSSRGASLLTVFRGNAGDPTIRKLLDTLADVATMLHKQNLLPSQNECCGKEGIRKSYSLSENSKKTFERIAKERGISRDTVLEAALEYALTLFENMQNSPQKKIESAKIVLDACDKMLDIYTEKRAADALQYLRELDDADFEESNELLMYIEQLYEFGHTIKTFIRRKENEIDKAHT